MRHDEPAEHPCYGRSWLFDSLDPLDHIEARAYCLNADGTDRCPLIAACRQLRDKSHPRDLEGTWAGVLYGATPTSLRIAREEAMFSEAEARAAHARFWGGARDARAVVGERTYQRRSARRRRGGKLTA